MIIQSLLDTDLYKLTMMQLVFHRYADVEVRYRLYCRNQTLDLGAFRDAIDAALADLGQLRYRREELDYLAQLPYMQADFIEYLRTFRLDPRHVHWLRGADGAWSIEVRGTWLRTILFEVFLLAIVSELYYRRQVPRPDFELAGGRLDAKIRAVSNSPHKAAFRFADFGTRRRFAARWHTEVVAQLAAALPEQFVGSSNIHLARTFGLRPVGTMAHEYLQAFQALTADLRASQYQALVTWLQEYPRDLHIALTDVVGIDAFLADFDVELAERYAGLRQDSGDPLRWADRVLGHYRQLGIDPRRKQLVFSDGLSMTRALQIHAALAGQAQTLFGIGTHLSNDVGYPALQLVMKMVACEGQTVAKISDSPGKATCDDKAYLRRLAQAYEVPEYSIPCLM